MNATKAEAFLAAQARAALYREFASLVPFRKRERGWKSTSGKGAGRYR